ncbi:MAG: class I SAM-dependent methyltransferase [Deltaproteobacteria bacterium]|nr:class I SAM-dependent methyltransferase [Deltaproteobacteria bacterium]
MEILKSRLDNAVSRREMHSLGIDFTAPTWKRIARKYGLLDGVNVGESSKSWDVLRTVKFVRDRLSPDAPILDIGAYASEVVCSLHRLGYANLTGIDLNPNIVKMPYADKVRYVTGDFLHMPFEESSFEAVTAISVIEHGFRDEPLLEELKRVIKPGGYFMASVDYWPEKIDTEGIRAFGMEWKIFSKSELTRFIDLSGKYGFSPVGELDFTASEPTVRWNGERYTFAWLAIRKIR